MRSEVQRNSLARNKIAKDMHLFPTPQAEMREIMKSVDLFHLSGKTALVTGGGRGIGKTIAFALAEAGAKVAVASRNEESCAEVANEITKQTGNPSFSGKLDVTEKQSVDHLIKSVNAKFGHIDILVNNSGATWGAPFEDMPLEKWEYVVKVNLTGTFLMSQAVVPEMEERKWGRIINISSVVGLVAPPDFMNTIGYTASKGGIISLTRELAMKLATSGVTANAVAPSFFKSKMSGSLLQKYGDQIKNGIPMRRLGEEDDLKGVIVFLASEASRFVTGQVISVDGGYTAA
jgi:NAD(P)-dependent dehydrogenase (short-subunit alcohol dehydrogenase family)